MNVKIYLLEGIVKWLVGGELFKFIQETVEAVNKSTISGEEKRAYVLERAKDLFSGVVTVLVNLAIEVAVLMLKQRIADGK